jgi:hypothetical protein
MPKVVYVQIQGNEKPARIEADSVEEGRDGCIVVKKGELLVGKFNNTKIAGWWICVGSA